MGANGSVVECLTRVQRVACLSLTGSTVLSAQLYIPSRDYNI